MHLSLSNLFEATTVVYEGAIVFVKLLLQFEGVSVWFKVACCYLIDVWLS